MLFEQAYETLEKRLGQRRDLRDDIKFEMQNVQDNILQADSFLPWFLLKEEQSAYTQIGDDRLRVPQNFLAEYEEGALFLIRDDGSIKPLFRENLDCLIRKYQDAQSEPVFYARTGKYFRLYPIPDKQYQIRTLCYTKADDLTEGRENVWLELGSDWLLAETGYIMADLYMQNSELAERFKVLAVRARQRLWREHEAQLNVNRNMIKGK